MKQKLLEIIKLLFGFILVNLLLFVLQTRKRAPKLLLESQNLVTSTGGRKDLVPGLTTERRPPA